MTLSSLKSIHIWESYSKKTSGRNFMDRSVMEWGIDFTYLSYVAKAIALRSNKYTLHNAAYFKWWLFFFHL